MSAASKRSSRKSVSIDTKGKGKGKGGKGRGDGGKGDSPKGKGKGKGQKKDGEFQRKAEKKQSIFSFLSRNSNKKNSTYSQAESEADTGAEPWRDSVDLTELEELEEESEEETTESSASADSRDEEFTAEQAEPAGDHVEQVRLPDTIKEMYVFLELLHDSCRGHRVYFCEDMTWKPKVDPNEAEKWHSNLPTSRRAVMGHLGVELLDKEIRRNEEQNKEDGENQREPKLKRRRCIIKVWQKSARSPEESITWLDTQVKLLSMERHPNVMLPRKVLEDERAYYVDFDAILTGTPLLQMILSDASLTERQVKKITHGLLRGLNHLHRNHMVHRDIKPDNIILEWQDPNHSQDLLVKNAKLPKGYYSVKAGVKHWKSGKIFKSSWTKQELVVNVRIVDLDLVTAFSGPYGQIPIEPGQEPQMVDEHGPRICGTPGYMAPEAYLSFTGPRGDLFGVGIVMYLMVRCDAPCHDAVLRTLEDQPLEDADEQKRQQISQAVANAIGFIDWDTHPWDQLPLVRDLCRQLIHPIPSSRGVDAGDVIHTAPWFQKQISVHKQMLDDLKEFHDKNFAGGGHDEADAAHEADNEQELDLNLPTVVGRSMRRAGLIEVKEDLSFKTVQRGKKRSQTTTKSMEPHALQPHWRSTDLRGSDLNSARGSASS